MSAKNSKENKKESTNGEVHKKLKIYKRIYTVRGGSLTIYPQKTQKDTKEESTKDSKEHKRGGHKRGVHKRLKRTQKAQKRREREREGGNEEG